jgi:hypothetical protein
MADSASAVEALGDRIHVNSGPSFERLYRKSNITRIISDEEEPQFSVPGAVRPGGQETLFLRCNLVKEISGSLSRPENADPRDHHRRMEKETPEQKPRSNDADVRTGKSWVPPNFNSIFHVEIHSSSSRGSVITSGMAQISSPRHF